MLRLTAAVGLSATSHLARQSRACGVVSLLSLTQGTPNLSAMQITYLRLKNYRCFEDFEIHFPTQSEDKTPINLHVILAPNMVGKSVLLKALRTAIAARFSKLGLNIGSSTLLAINAEDHRIRSRYKLSDIGLGKNDDFFVDQAKELYINAKALSIEWKNQQWQPVNLHWELHKTSSKNTKTRSDKGKTELAQLAYDSYERCNDKQEAQAINPLLLYVGVEYLHQPKPEMNTFKSDGSAEQGYWYCLDQKNMENFVFTWFETLEKARREQQQSKIAATLYGSLPNSTLSLFKQAVNILLPECEDVTWVKDVSSRNEKYDLFFTIKNEGIRKYKMLSDGFRYLVLLAGELVARATLLNKHLGENVLAQITGCVMIDELGTHLHPSLQNEVLKRLSVIFPKVQFIITTHSPLLVNGLRKEQIHLLRQDPKDGRRYADHPTQDVIGMGAERILLELFGLKTTFDDIAIKQRDRYAQLLNKKIVYQLDESETQELQELQAKLSKFRYDDSLNQPDEIEIAVKEYLKQRAKPAKPQATVSETEAKKAIYEAVNALLDKFEL